MSRQYESRGYSNGDYDAPRSFRRRGSFEPGRRGGPRPDVYDDDAYRTLRITNLNPRVTDREVSDAVYRQFRSFGEYNVKVTYYGDQRLAFVNFRFAEDAAAAMREFYNRLVLFDIPVRIGAVYPKPPPPRGPFVDRYERSFSPGRRFYPEGDFYPRREFYPRGDFDDHIPPPPRDNIVHRMKHLQPEDDNYATRTLFVGNIDPDISAADLKAVFDEFGYVEDVDIKRPPNGNGNPYAFIRYFNLDMAHTAKVKLSGKFIGPYQCKIGYGKPVPNSCVWIGGVGPWIGKSGLVREFERFGTVLRVVWPEGRDFAYLTYNNVESAKDAVESMRGFRFKGAQKRLRTDFSEAKNMDSDLNSKSFKHFTSLEPRRRVHGQRSSVSRSVSRSSGRSSRTESSAGSVKRQKKRKAKETHKGSKRHRQDSDDDHYSGGLLNEHSVKKKRHRSASLSSSASLHSEASNHGFQPERNAGDMQSDTEMFQVKTIAELSQSLPIVWTGSLSLKNNMFFVNFHSVAGKTGLVDVLLCDSKRTRITNLKLTQRLRMDPPKLDEVKRRIQLSGSEWSVLLALPGASSAENVVGNMQERPIKNLVTYLRQKEAAGVLSLPPNSGHGQETGLLHTFAPCDFAHKYLLQRAPSLELDSQAEDYVIIILVRVNI